jgi:transcriptional regulator with XRE-family HTH domain
VFNVGLAMDDMARQIRNFRTADQLTLQKLATRSGVAASTIHKIEAKQMIPTVSVLLKIAKGLQRRPDELVRDDLCQNDGKRPISASKSTLPPDHDSTTRPTFGVWHIDLAAQEFLPALELDPLQRAILLVEKGVINLETQERHVRMDAGDYHTFEGGRIRSPLAQPDPSSLTLIVSPPGDLDRHLGTPSDLTPAL